ncbi:hypothetical protein J7481_19000 [Labrenzia sp. R4_2]|nr:hypothetical protein [Labrenzia sp. R4_2]
MEPICRVLPIAPSARHENVAKRQGAERLSVRPRRGIALKIEAPCLRGKLPRLWYAQDPAAIAAGGLRYRPFHVARLMRVMGLQGNIRGKRLKTTFPDKSAPNPLDRMNRPFDNAVGSLAYDG